MPGSPADYIQYRFYFDVAQFALTGAIGVYVWLSNRARVNQKRFVALEKSVKLKLDRRETQAMIDRQLSGCEEHQARTRRLEATTSRLGSELREIPKRRDLEQIEKRLGQINSNVSRLEGRFEGVDRLTRLLNEYMVTQGGCKT